MSSFPQSPAVSPMGAKHTSSHCSENSVALAVDACFSTSMTCVQRPRMLRTGLLLLVFLQLHIVILHQHVHLQEAVLIGRAEATNLPITASCTAAHVQPGWLYKHMCRKHI